MPVLDDAVAAPLILLLPAGSTVTMCARGFDGGGGACGFAPKT